MKRSFRYLALVLLLTACTATQQRYTSRPGPAGVVDGTVTSDGTPLPGATVTITSPSRPAHTAVTDAHGMFAVRGLQPGTYTVKTELQGLRTVTQTVVLTAGHGITLVADMKVSSITESITVTASAPGGWGSPMTYAKESLGAPAPVYVPEPQYASIREHGFVATNEAATATFAIDVDRASYTNVRRFLNARLLPPPDAVRIEEMLNYFSYSYPQPEGDAPFSVTTEVAGCPWNMKNRLLRVGIQGRNLEQWRMAPNNLVFLIDVSGSMMPAERLPLLQQAFDVLVRELRAEDRVAIVVYAGAAGLVLPSTSGADKRAIRKAIDALEAGGSTAGGAGIELAYKIAAENFLEHGNNRVILATDGDFNVGVSTLDQLEALIESKSSSGIFLSVVGVGDTNLQDAKMETLADKGNGNYSYLDTLQEAEMLFRSGLTGTLVTIAQDVKVQLDFDPAAVESYRQIGYENRALAKEDFDDDKKDAGELGAGHSVTALFEIVPARRTRGPIATLRLRWKEPRGTISQPLLAEVVDEGKSAYEASPDMQFAAAVAEMGMLLRDSPHKGSASWEDVFHLARVAQGVDLDGMRDEFVKIAKIAKKLK
ncbi:MAG TPA: von Willebrand factor type A domain-containing protein [Thermoanaerobaculia bacterium]|nr:von Willebrand factor type A domain-containing protein [Thermoanaerobaculia bacterium]